MESKENKNYKDSIFRMLFNDVRNIPDLYRDITKRELKPDAKVEIITLNDTLYKNRINDLGFTVDNKLFVLVEQQSTYNPNMPLRMLLYAAREYESLLDEKFIYRSTLVHIPSPEFYVLYLGKPEDPYIIEQKLSDAYLDSDENNFLELKTKHINLNSPEFVNGLTESSTLYQYIYAINKLMESKDKRECLQGLIRQNILRTFFMDNSKEVLNVLTFAFDKDAYGEVKKEEGEAVGEVRMLKKIVASMLRKNKTLAEIADEIDVPLAKIKEIAKTISEEE